MDEDLHKDKDEHLEDFRHPGTLWVGKASQGRDTSVSLAQTSYCLDEGQQISCLRS